MKQRTMDEMISYFNQQVSEMDIKREDKIKLLGMITAIGYENKKLERKTGRWIPQDHNHTHGNVSTLMYFSPVCSECGHAGDFNMNFCPNCGADMRGEQDG